MLHNNVYPIIILVEPQLAANVGMIARAMLNFNFTQLRIVKPRDKEILTQAIAASCGAEQILSKCEVFDSLQVAVADLQMIYAMSNRDRDMHKPVLFLNQVFSDCDSNNKIYQPHKIGFLFGKESRGLSNNDLNYANSLIKIDTNPEFSSLNIVQAVVLVCYEWQKKLSLCKSTPKLIVNSLENKTNFKNLKNELASFSDLEYFFNYIESFLNVKTFYPLDKKENMIRNFRNIFLRSKLTKGEIKTLFRVIKALIGNK